MSAAMDGLRLADDVMKRYHPVLLEREKKVKQEVTPMMQHYLQTKEEYKDCILFLPSG